MSTREEKKDLVVWQKSMNLVETVYRLSFRLPQLSNGDLFHKCAVRPFQFRQISPKAAAGKQPENTIITFQLAAVHYWS